MKHLNEDQLIGCFYSEPENESDLVHIAECETCRKAFNQLKQELSLLDATDDLAIPPDFGRRVWKDLAPSLPGMGRSSASRIWLWTGLAAAAVLLAFLLGRLRPIEPWSIAENPGQERILNSKLYDHLERTTQILGQVNQDTAQADGEALQWLLRDNRIYRQVLAQTQQTETMGVLEDLEFLLLRLKHPDPETRLSDEINHDVLQLLKKLREMKHQNSIAQPTATTDGPGL